MKNVKQILTICCIISSSIGLAQENQDAKQVPSAETIIARLDLNKDGKLDRTEIQGSKKAKLIENFEKIDQDKDGFIDEQELTAVLERRKKQHM